MLAECASLVPRPHPDFITQPWKKFGRRPGSKTPDFSPWLRDKIWVGPGDEAKSVLHYSIQFCKDSESAT